MTIESRSVNRHSSFVGLLESGDGAFVSLKILGKLMAAILPRHKIKKVGPSRPQRRLQRFRAGVGYRTRRKSLPDIGVVRGIDLQIPFPDVAIVFPRELQGIDNCGVARQRDPLPEPVGQNGSHQLPFGVELGLLFYHRSKSDYPMRSPSLWKRMLRF